MADRKILLVEGRDDEHVVKHLCGYHNLPHLDEIVQLGGIDELIEAFPVRLKESNVESLGVLVDADTDLQARWQSLRDRLREAGYPSLPPFPPPSGTIVPPPADTILPRVGIWLMPNNQTDGILEDFLRFLVPPESPLFSHAEQSVRGIPHEERRFTVAAEPKVLIHTWLAWQEQPGKPLGLAITARYLDPGVPEVAVFMTWLRELFYA